MDEGWLVDRLSHEGLLPPDRLAAARARQDAEGGDLAAHLFAIGAIDETSLLRAISIAHRTSYVTIDKLARARIAADVLERVPSDVAAVHRIVPLSYDAPTRTLSIVASDPTSHVLEAARSAANVASVRAYVALPQAVDAAIRRFYRGEQGAFAPLEAPPMRPRRPSGPMAIGGIGASLAEPIAQVIVDFEPEADFAKSDPTRRSSPPPFVSAGHLTAETPVVDLRPPSSDARTTADLRPRPAQDLPGVPMDGYLETLKVMVSLSEMGSASWRQGHAAEVARQARRIGLRIGLPESELAELTVAAYLHDVGKPDEPHLTLLGLSMAPDQRLIAERVHAAPGRLFAAAGLRPATLAALGSLYERVDGQGLPRRRRGREVPLYARVLALVDAYVDLTVNPFGAAGGNVADREAALATLERHKDSLFDANLVDILRQVISGDDLRHRLLGDRARVLLVDADAEATSMIELKLVAEGYEVRSARSSSEALRAMAQWTPDLVVSEVKLEPADGFALLEEARQHQRTHEIPFFFLSERSTAVDLDRGFALGAADYLTKPVALDVLSVKVRRFVAERARARDAVPGRRVVGSLAEMSVADVVEVLAKGRKTGALRLSPPAAGGASPRGDVWLDGGKLVHAACPPGLAGQEALYSLLRLREGEFAFEAGVAPPTRSIDAPTEWLLLEALRRIDEA